MPTLDTASSSSETSTFPVIETWPNQYVGRDYTITIETPEFTSVCPKTGLPDYGVITINYTPDALCIELKAFKYYLLGYRNHGIFYENVVNKILDDIVSTCDPTWVEVIGEFTPRGGISTSVRVEHRKS